MWIPDSQFSFDLIIRIFSMITGFCIVQETDFWFFGGLDRNGNRCKSGARENVIGNLGQHDDP
ncbi:hypothetical protein GLOIN_2v1842506 [Rhizophagus irregularis DAOM 181602=DAOM 197198]|uniref:Uncharacterized protein n=1 Tax=Rhizophagus irregularis (strain DAOM 181602 / DAOM 197198 / MUCL 43194) TaxID=747089 RepID=A0A2P4PUU7_RHIID|nr:hypothetical protein GLOIN_2v1842506 [Rhizophagus irregularis DAOM 181602=DAOM 197198]POG69173.1 hypothetical protein GLOIN_2v1842506 [Rhizophagus irregularis DAOM 181602=DAOM 197198]|eukprot:XP_025176039.1 hypothetical protein GLOIN_2v1842506 [Rhizophagus irregularis DAOM 181602=DAOM 197198]